MPAWMPAWMQDLDVGTIAALVVLVFVLGRAAWKSWPGIRSLVRLADLLDGLPDFMERTDASMRRTDESLKAVDHELHPNHGSSMKDSLGRLEAQLSEVVRTQKSILDRLDKDHARIKALENPSSEG